MFCPLAKLLKYIFTLPAVGLGADEPPRLQLCIDAIANKAIIENITFFIFVNLTYL
jgi:hypothetical protein